MPWAGRALLQPAVNDPGIRSRDRAGLGSGPSSAWRSQSRARVPALIPSRLPDPCLTCSSGAEKPPGLSERLRFPAGHSNSFCLQSWEVSQFDKSVPHSLQPGAPRLIPVRGTDWSSLPSPTLLWAHFQAWILQKPLPQTQDGATATLSLVLWLWSSHWLFLPGSAVRAEQSKPIPGIFIGAAALESFSCASSQGWKEPREIYTPEHGAERARGVWRGRGLVNGDGDGEGGAELPHINRGEMSGINTALLERAQQCFPIRAPSRTVPSLPLAGTAPGISWRGGCRRGSSFPVE